ncbi:hypothetical protein OOK28_36655 [Streptomyces sp. NBC_00687]|nr:hypothetical protein [Streptomyces sp. NBC_00687]
MKTVLMQHPVLVLMTVLVCLTAVAVTAELVARKIVEDRVRAVPAWRGTNPTVDLHSGWGLAGLAGDKLPEVSLASDDATMGVFTDVRLRIQVFDLQLEPTPKFQRVHGLAVVSTGSLTHAFQRVAPTLGVTSVTMNVSDGTMTVHSSGGSRRVGLETQPDGAMAFAVQGVKEQGKDDHIDVDALTKSGAQGPAKSLALKIQVMAIERDGLHLILEGSTGDH